MAGAIGITLALGHRQRRASLLHASGTLSARHQPHRVQSELGAARRREPQRRDGYRLTADHARHGAGQRATKPYIVVSLEDRRLWYKLGDTTLYTTQVAVGSGKTLVQKAGKRQEFKFDTPRGRLVMQSKEMDPVWVPPDWHYVEQAKKKGLGIMALDRKKAIPAGDGTVIEVDGNDVVKRGAGRRRDPARGQGRARDHRRGQHHRAAVRHQPAQVQRHAGRPPAEHGRRVRAARHGRAAFDRKGRESRLCPVTE